MTVLLTLFSLNQRLMMLCNRVTKPGTDGIYGSEDVKIYFGGAGDAGEAGG